MSLDLIHALGQQNTARSQERLLWVEARRRHPKDRDRATALVRQWCERDGLRTEGIHRNATPGIVYGDRL